MNLKTKFAFSILMLVAAALLTLIIVVCIIEPFTLVCLGATGAFFLVAWAGSTVIDWMDNR